MSFFKKTIQEKKSESKKTNREIELKKESWFEPEGELAIDVYQENGEIVIEAPVAGIRIEDLEVVIENDTIEIKGKREKTNQVKSENYLLKECYWGSFSRKAILPVEVDESKAEATIKKGVLTIRVPKIEKEQVKRKLKIKSK